MELRRLAEVAWSRARVHLVHRLLCPVCAWQDGAGDRATCRAPRMDYSTMCMALSERRSGGPFNFKRKEKAPLQLATADRASFGSRSAYGSVRLPSRLRDLARSPTAARDEQDGSAVCIGKTSQ